MTTKQMRQRKQKNVPDPAQLTQTEVQIIRSLMKDILFSMYEHNASQKEALGVLWPMCVKEDERGQIAFGHYSAIRTALKQDVIRRKKFEMIQRKLRRML